jgi:hypothetical protein
VVVKKLLPAMGSRRRYFGGIPVPTEEQNGNGRKSDATLAAEGNEKRSFPYGHVNPGFPLGHQPLPLFWRYHMAGSTMEKPSKGRVPRGLDDEKLAVTYQHSPLEIPFPPKRKRRLRGREMSPSPPRKIVKLVFIMVMSTPIFH